LEGKPRRLRPTGQYRRKQVLGERVEKLQAKKAEVSDGLLAEDAGRDGGSFVGDQARG